MIEDEDLELDRFIEDLENDAKEIDDLCLKLEIHLEWFDIVIELQGVSEKFISNMNSLSSIYKAISANTDNSFLIGTLWSGVLSAYEGFVHDLFDLLLSKQVHSEEATKKSSTLEKKISSQLRISDNKSISAKNLRAAFRKATLNNPINSAKLANHLFNTNIPLIDEDAIEAALKIRNAFTHNNGGVDVTLSDLEAFHEKIDYVVSKFINEVLSQANNHISNN